MAAAPSQKSRKINPTLPTSPVGTKIFHRRNSYVEKREKIIPRGHLHRVLTVVWDLLVYFGTKLISASWYHHDMTMPADHAVPFLPWTVVIYFGSYAMWFAGYYLFAHQEAKLRNRFFLADTMAKFVCLACFLLLENVFPFFAAFAAFILELALFVGIAPVTD